jgi:hypothetical protein
VFGIQVSFNYLEADTEKLANGRKETYKIPNEDAPIWTDHDEDCHGSYESFENNHRYASGFLWGCCEEPITNMGCMRTNHSNPKNG